MEEVYVNQLLDSEEPNRVDYSQIYLTRHDCKELIKECLFVYEQLTFYETNVDELEINNEIVKRIIDDFKKELEKDDTDRFEYYYGNVLEFIFDVLDESDELIKTATFTNFIY